MNYLEGELQGSFGEFFLSTGPFKFSLKGITGLFGPSGAGKSTFLKSLAGLAPAKGKLIFKNQIWLDAKHFWPTQKRNIGLVFQDVALFPHLSVEGNLEYAWKRRKNNRALDRNDVIDQIGIRHLLARSVSDLSGGEAKRVAIARSLFNCPNLLLMDEPLSGLDQKSREGLMFLIKELACSFEIPIVYVSHSMEELRFLSNDLYFIESGKLKKQESSLAKEINLDQAILSSMPLTGVGIEKQIPAVLKKIDQTNNLNVHIMLEIDRQQNLQMNLSVHALDKLGANEGDRVFICY